MEIQSWVIAGVPLHRNIEFGGSSARTYHMSQVKVHVALDIVRLYKTSGSMKVVSRRCLYRCGDEIAFERCVDIQASVRSPLTQLLRAEERRARW